MSKTTLAILALLAAPHASPAQFPGVDITGSMSASVSAPVPCETCSDLAVHRSVGVLVRNTIGLGYRALRWGDQGSQSNHRMSSDLMTVDLYVPTRIRVRPFVSGGTGRSSANILVSDGGHAYFDYGPTGSLATRFWGAGVDIRVYRRLALISMVSSTSTASSNTKVHCTNYNYLTNPSSTYTCGGPDAQQFAVRGFSVGIGIR